MPHAGLNWFGRTGLVGEFKSFLRKTPDDYHGPPDCDPADEAADAADWDEQND